MAAGPYGDDMNNTNQTSIGRHPYVWRHMYSREQLQRVTDIRRTRRQLDWDIYVSSKFSRCQLIAKEKVGFHDTFFHGVYEEREVRFYPLIKSLRLEFAMRIYEAAVQEALIKFPGFTDYYVEDGMDIGERRLRFVTNKHDLALPFIFNRMRSLAEEGAITVSEGFSVRPEYPDRGYGSDNDRSLSLVVNLGEFEKGNWEAFKESLLSNQPFHFDPTPQQFSYKEIHDYFTEVSLPELEYINWHDVRKPLSSTEAMLFTAAENLDADGVAKCLADGADPNSLDKYDHTPLTSVVDAYSFVYGELAPEEWEHRLVACRACIMHLLEAGAHLDVIGQDGMTALTWAILRKDEPLVEWFLALGADDTNQFHEDSWPGDWPPAWDYAASDCSAAFTEEERQAAERTWRILRRHRQAPDGTMPDERPDW